MSVLSALLTASFSRAMTVGRRAVLFVARNRMYLWSRPTEG